MTTPTPMMAPARMAYNEIGPAGRAYMELEGEPREFDVEQFVLQQKFDTLSKQWKIERGVTSSIQKMAMATSYQGIIAMGPKAVPIILRELEKKPDHWFWALRILTGKNPVKEEDRGQVKKMASTWVQWGKDQGLI